jgi:Fe-S-cluster-containing hydrogenase component 2
MTEKETPKKVTRRDFIRDAAIVGGAVTGAGVLAGCGPGTPIATPEVIKETVEVTKEVPVEVIKEVPVEVIKEVPVGVPLPPPAMGRVVCDYNLCAGCRTCEAVCTLVHEGVQSRVLSRIQVRSSPIKSWRDQAFTCKQCDGPECLWACPTGALHVDDKTGARVIDPEKCLGCKLCLQACPAYPNSPIRYDASRNICIKCDLCGGDPQCVFHCPEGALKFEKI